ncbi:hypothetical protein PoMZ_02551 [Pyricularia oryzae]|uniref:Phosphodiester glycosidase domain-containing protein n=1 Tax=Pyricularia oryzae TaxID=318829 RepID=A0A4P7N527_PYROR|nr:hypothetical protein PoMZ_02551 [Pyricularia oryzae]
MLLLGFALSFTLVNAAAYQRFPLDKNNAVVYQFHTIDGWEHDPILHNDARAKTMMQHMNPKGIFTAVVIPKSRMSIVGPSQGTQSPDEYARNNPSKAPFLLMTGGFFVTRLHKYFDVLPNGQPGKALPPGTYLGWPVGPTSTTPNSFKIASLYKDQYEMLKSDDGKSFLTSGPSLKKLQVEENRFQHVPPYDEVPGGQATVINPNERLVYVQFGAEKMVFTYTSLRTRAVGINKMRALINLFLQTYLHKDISDATVALNLDGGKSVILAYQEPGQPLKLLAQGFRKEEQIPGLRPFPAGTSRTFPTMVKIELGGRANPLGKVMRRSGLPLDPAKHCGSGATASRCSFDLPSDHFRCLSRLKSQSAMRVEATLARSHAAEPE